MLGALASAHVSTVEMLGLNGNSSSVMLYFVSMFSPDMPLKFSSVSGGLQVSLPIIPPSSDLKWAWALKIELQVIASQL